jgi:hypothetical protein
MKLKEVKIPEIVVNISFYDSSKFQINPRSYVSDVAL